VQRRQVLLINFLFLYQIFSLSIAPARVQKIIEVGHDFIRSKSYLTSIEQSAPSRLPRPAIQPLLDVSLKIANHLKYKWLGTFDYLVNTQTQDWVFLEINPRIQVEHTNR